MSDDGGRPDTSGEVAQPRELAARPGASDDAAALHPVLDLRALVGGATRVLDEAGVPSPAADARALAAFLLGRERLPVGTDISLSAAQASQYAQLVERRRTREPLQHIVGTTGFRYLTLQVAPGVFVPRPETEVVAQVAIDEARRLADSGHSPTVVDLCCGAGGIAISLATEIPSALVTAVDISLDAILLTRRNAVSAGVGAIRIEQGDVREPYLLADLAGGVDVVVSNPPYIPPDAVPVDPEVRDHDPAAALYGGGADGLEIPRAVAAAAVRLLRPGGLLVMEHAEVQAESARRLAIEAGLTDPATTHDLTGRPRAVGARARTDGEPANRG